MFVKRDTEEIMSVQLLDKTRKINKLLHNNNSSKVVFNDICAVLTNILDSNVLVVSKKGKILGVSKCSDVREINELITESVGSHIDKMLNERLLSILSTKENVNLETLGFSPEADLRAASPRLVTGKGVLGISYQVEGLMNFPVEIIPCPLVREESGLALSSRNKYLSDSDKQIALSISKAIFAIRDLYRAGVTDTKKLFDAGLTNLHKNVELEYLEFVDENTFKPVEEVKSDTICAIAARVGNVRLIDNIVLEV